MKAQAYFTEDFPITGSGNNPAWQKCKWYPINVIGKNGKYNYATQFKLLWSKVGMYFFFECEDSEITCTKMQDFEELYLEDVIEVFLWPDKKQVVYFEYEISPLGYELPLIVPNTDGAFHGWLPFKYDAERKVVSRTTVLGGEKKPLSKARSWCAEFFVPFRLLIGMSNCPPKIGTEWRANFCRLDYGDNHKTQWSWVIDGMEDNFHNFNNFGSIEFIKE